VRGFMDDPAGFEDGPGDRSAYRSDPASQLAVRMLRGAGRGELHAYREPMCPCLDILALQQLDDGRVLAVAQRPEAWESETDWESHLVPVRLHVEMMAALPAVAIHAADLHALGWARMVRTDELAALIGRLSDEITLCMGHPDVLVLELTLDRTLVHSPAGVHRIDAHALPTGPVFPSGPDTLAAFDAVLGMGEEVLSDLVEAVTLGIVDGSLMATMGNGPACRTLRGRTFPVDVASHGVTLLHLRETGAITAHVRFACPATSVDDVSRALTDIVTRAVLPTVPPQA